MIMAFRFLARVLRGRHLGLAVAFFGLGVLATEARQVKVVAFGDSLSAGYQLGANDAFPAVLEAALRAKGLDVIVENAGVSGDTASGGRERLDWSVPEDADLVIVELGANDALRGIDPTITEQALDDILAHLKERKIGVLLAGMLAPRNNGPEFVTAFDAIYPRLAEKHGVPLYPFFLEGVQGKAELNLNDGMHPNSKGVRAIVTGILPVVEKLVREKAAN